MSCLEDRLGTPRARDLIHLPVNDEISPDHGRLHPKVVKSLTAEACPGNQLDYRLEARPV